MTEPTPAGVWVQRAPGKWSFVKRDVLGKDAAFEVKHPRAADGTFVETTGGATAAAVANVTAFAQRMTEAVATNGGFTFENRTGNVAVHGIAVAPFPELSGVFDAKTFTTADAAGWIEQHRRLLRHADLHVGGWRDDSSGKVYLDIVRIYEPRDRDIALAVGRRRNQISVADLDAISRGDWDHAIIPTGGTGTAVVGKAGRARGKFILFPASVTAEELVASLGAEPIMHPVEKWWNALTKFDESKIKRHPKGDEAGGQFASKDGGAGDEGDDEDEGTPTIRSEADKLRGRVQERMARENAERARNAGHTPEKPKIVQPRAAPVKSTTAAGALRRLRERRLQEAFGKFFGWEPRVSVFKNDPEDAPECVEALLAGTRPGAVHKSADEKQMVAGWASVVADGAHRPIVDRQGDVISLDEITKAAGEFMALPVGKRMLDIDHDYRRAGTVIEGLVVTPLLKSALGLPAATPLGFFIAAKVDDPRAWQRVKARDLAAFSIGGSAIREPVK